MSMNIVSSQGDINRQAIVTVICPIYNDADVCVDAIESVLRQTMSRLRLVIFDNGSTDNTREVISKFRDPRVEVIESHINLKSEVTASLMQAVSTKYIAQIYSDDIWESDKLEISIKALEESNADAVFSNCRFINDEGNFLSKKEVPASQFVGDISSMSVDEHLHHFVFRGNSLHPVSMVIRADSYREIGGVRPYLHSIGDMEFFCRLLLSRNVIFLRENLQRIRIKLSGRQNESAPSIIKRSRILGERVRFIQSLRSDQFLRRMERVFLPHIKSAEIPWELKKWFLGHQLLRLGEPDYNFSAMQILYEALDENFTEIETYLVALHSMTVGQYVEQLVSRTFANHVDDRSAHEISRLNSIILQYDNIIKQQAELISAGGAATANSQPHHHLALELGGGGSEIINPRKLQEELELTRQQLAIAVRDFEHSSSELVTARQQLDATAVDLNCQKKELDEVRRKFDLAVLDFENQREDAKRLRAALEARKFTRLFLAQIGLAKPNKLRD